VKLLPCGEWGTTSTLSSLFLLFLSLSAISSLFNLLLDVLTPLTDSRCINNNCMPFIIVSLLLLWLQLVFLLLLLLLQIVPDAKESRQWHEPNEAKSERVREKGRAAGTETGRDRGSV